MLVIFLGDTGQTVTFDMQLAMGSVFDLQAAIASRLHIPIEKQVLLSSRGETLQANARVGSFSTGTETNPVYLFNKSNIESATPPATTVQSTNDGKLLSQVDASFRMRPSQETVVRRAQLAAEFQRHASELYKSCCQLVHEQGMQRKAWISVVTNLQQIERAFSDRVISLQDLYNEVLSCKDKFAEQLQLFDGSVAELRKIILPQCLLKSQEFSNLLSPSTRESFYFVTNSADTISDEPISLLDWISAHDQKSQLEQLGVHCQKALDQLSVGHLEDILRKMSKVQESLSNDQMKQITGLDERVHLMEQQLNMTAQLQQEQADNAQGFQQNKMRVQTLRDASVLPDLCAGQERQLRMLITNHSQLNDARCRFANAKRELCGNLHTRLRWVMFQQKQVADCDSSIILRCESLKKLKKKFEVVEQINSAARVFITTAAEVVRRRAYNKDFITWRNDVIKLSRDAQSEEAALREKFQDTIGTHFVQCLFPGLSDRLPTLPTGQLPMLNLTLPEITEDDLDTLRATLPSLAEYARFSEPHHHFSGMTDRMYDGIVKAGELAADSKEVVMLRNEVEELMRRLEEEKAQAEKLELRNQLEISFQDQKKRLEEEKDCLLVESQREWEERLSVSALKSEKTNEELGVLRDRVVELEQQLSLTQRELKEKSELSIVLVEKERTCTEELERQKAEFEMRQEWKERVENVRREEMERMNQRHQQEIEALMEQQKLEMSTKLNELTAEWETKCIALENDLKELESSRSELEVKHKENEHQLMSKLKGEYEARITTLQTENQQELEVMRLKHDSMLKMAVAKGLDSGKDEARKERELEMVELKREMEKLRTELSEKAEEDMIDGMEKLFEKEKREWEEERQKALSQNEELSKQITELQAQVKELEEDRKVLEPSTEASSVETQNSRSGSGVGVVEPDQKVDVLKELMEKERDLKEARQEVAESKKMLEDKDQVEKKLLKRSLEMDAKCADLSVMVSDLTKTLTTKGILYDFTKASKSYEPTVAIANFRVGDLALFIYTEEIDTYVAFTISPSKYFMHSESQAALLAHIGAGEPRKTYVIARVTDREYCQCKKKSNRFKLPVGEKFYRLFVQQFLVSTQEIAPTVTEKSPNPGRRLGSLHTN